MQIITIFVVRFVINCCVSRYHILRNANNPIANMSKKRVYHVQVRTSFTEAWRYNIYMLCGESDAEGKSLNVVPVQSKVASVGDNLRVAPAGFGRSREIEATLEASQTVEVFVYVVPHTLPTNSEPEHSAIVGEDHEPVSEPTEDVPEESLLPEEDPNTETEG